MTTRAQSAKPKTSYYYKLFRVKRSDGRVTTVSVDPILATRACQAMGGLKSVGKLVRDAALTYEDSMYKNCSGFVSQQLRQAVEQAVTDRRAATTAATAMASTAAHA